MKHFVLLINFRLSSMPSKTGGLHFHVQTNAARLRAKGKTCLRAWGCYVGIRDQTSKVLELGVHERYIFQMQFFFRQAQDRGVSNFVVGIIFGSYSFTAFLFAPITGRLVSQSESCEELRAK